MRSALPTIARTLVAGALVVLSGGCGAGGFGSNEPVPDDRTISRYVALGDGFAAAPYVGKRTSQDGCLRSAGNYPALLATLLEVEDVVDVSCYGTGTKAVTQPVTSPVSKEKLAAQIDAVDRRTELITLGTGLADEDLERGLFQVCLTSAPCAGGVTIPELLSQLEGFESRLTAAVRALQEKAPEAAIVLVGYPQLMPAKDSCPALPAVDADELDAAYVVLQKVNAAIQDVALQTGSTFVNVAALTADHHACADDPWVNGYRSVTGKSKAWHPLAAEQKAVAAEIAARVSAR